MHEIIHAITSNYLINNETSKFHLQLKALYQDYSNYIKTNNIEKPYALTNLSEFIAEGLTNEKVIETLKKIPYTNNKSIFDKLVSIIKELFGDISENNLYNNLLKGFGEFVTENYDITNVEQQAISKYSEYLSITNNPTIEGFKQWIKTDGIKPGVQELFESNPELANQVYEALGFKQTITQDNKSYYRGQLEPFKLDSNGNLILEPKYAGWQEEISYDKYKGMGISLSPNLSVSNAQANMFYEGKLSRPEDEGWMDERDSEDWSTRTIDEGYYVVQLDKKYIQDNFKDIFDNENYEQRIGSNKNIIIPKGKFKIENIKPDLVEGEDYQLVTPQQKQQATFLFSEFLDVYLQDYEQVEKILKQENIIQKKCS